MFREKRIAQRSTNNADLDAAKVKAVVKGWQNYQHLKFAD